MKKILVFTLLICGFSSCAQELTCADFKNGKFLIPGDSLNVESYMVTRKNGRQVELDENGDEILVDIEYIDDCNYILTYNKTTKKLDDLAKYINSSGGIRVKVLKIQGDTLTYSGLIENDSLSYEMPGKLVKLK